MAKQYDKILGLFMVIMGLLGYIPGLTPNNLLFGTFLVGPVINTLHLLGGVVLSGIGFSPTVTETTARNTALGVGILFAIITLLAFLGNGNVLNMMQLNTADTLLYLVVALTGLAVGLARDRRIPV